MARLVLAALLCVCLSQFTVAEEVSEGEKLFALKIKTLLVEKCNACHGDNPDEIEGGLNTLSREGLLKGGDGYGEDVLIPGEGEKSFLYVATTRKEAGYEMPPKESEQLSEEETWWIRDWINTGAPWPDDDRVAKIQAEYAEGEVVKTSGGLGDDWTNRRYKPEHLWAYRPLNVTSIPAGTNPVDWFVDQGLSAAKLPPAPSASAAELVRRIRFDLTGLPPTTKDVKSFVAAFEDNPSDAVRQFANRLMQSPHYGEHFARQWLDVTRYADTAGFANDYSRPNAWRYRDYVVRSFNEDKPYNEFVRQQIAGDEMDAGNSDNVIATGFLRMGPWEQTGMSVFRVTRQQWLDDVTDSVGQTFLAHPLQCCKCHDHKFDPLPTRDYYSMMAVFTTTQFGDPVAPFTDKENRAGFDAARQWINEKTAAYKRQEAELNKQMAKLRQQETGDAKVGDNGLNPGDEASLSRIKKNITRHGLELDKTKPIAFSVYTGKTIKRNNVSGRLKPEPKPWGKGELEPDTILTGGDAYARGEKVTPAPISAAVSLGKMGSPAFPTGKGKRRLALANWIVDKQNPLTARVIVNRVWAWHFGQGIAGNPNNFGATGDLPTHPELLDYLANWFVQNDYSIKKLNELIVTSRAFQRSSRHPDKAIVDDLDPKRNLYSVFLPRRLTAEELRDAMLAISGELNRTVGGIPCRPDINSEVAMQPRQIMGGTASVYEPDPLPSQRNRRSIYTEKIRGLRDPFFETFNQPGPDKSCELRETSTVAPQALTMMNAEESQDRSLAFAAKLMERKLSDQLTIRVAFMRAYGRPPTDSERDACIDHWKETTKAEAAKTYQAKTYASQTVRTVMAEKTGEPYDFVEFMPAFKTYQSDLQPHEVDARTRGLAQVCLVLLNSNEFAFLD